MMSIILAFYSLIFKTSLQEKPKRIKFLYYI